MMVVDPYRAILAAGMMVMIGVIIFVVRNKRMLGHRMRQSHE